MQDEDSSRSSLKQIYFSCSPPHSYDFNHHVFLSQPPYNRDFEKFKSFIHSLWDFFSQSTVSISCNESTICTWEYLTKALFAVSLTFSTISRQILLLSSCSRWGNVPVCFYFVLHCTRKCILQIIFATTEAVFLQWLNSKGITGLLENGAEAAAGI